MGGGLLVPVPAGSRQVPGAGGYSVLRADDMDSALALDRGRPFVKRDGSLQAAEAVSP